MKILCVINNFDAGGAQRQLANLACGLKERGHQVETFIYYPDPHYNFFRPQIEQAGVIVHEMNKGKGFSLKVIWKLMQCLHTGKYDYVISFLDPPNAYAELARLGYPRTRLIASERSSHYSERPIVGIIKRVLHLSATHVTTNNYAHANWLYRFPWLRNKVVVIYNGLAIGKSPKPLSRPHHPWELRLLAVGRIVAQKNILNLIEALYFFHQTRGFTPQLSWIGKAENTETGRKYRVEVDTLLDQYPVVKRSWHWLGERDDVPKLLAQHHALIHPAIYEGLPNVVCEALAAGIPVLASNVCDHALLIKDNERGFLFNPENPESISGAIENLLHLSQNDWQRLSDNALLYAAENLTIERLVEAYEGLLLK